MARSRCGQSSIVGAEGEPSALLERIFREEAGRLTATLVRLLGDFDLAEEMVSEAMVEALEHWPRDGVPERATSWLLTTAKRKGLDRLRRNARYREKLALVAALSDRTQYDVDDRLTLIFTCCHPVLAPEARIALTLRAVVGLTTAEIARAFLISAETLTKRIARAKRKIVDANVPYRVPSSAEMASRLTDVLTVIYLVFNEGYLATGGSAPLRRDLARDAEWLATLLVRLLPDEPEPLGLLALIRLHLARWESRLDSDGRLVLLEHQDRSLWDRGAIAQAIHLIEHAASYRRPGAYQVEASMAALHCEAREWDQTDWPQVLALYSVLQRIDPSPVVRLNGVVALSYVEGPEAALRELAALEPSLNRYYLFHAIRAGLYRRVNQTAEADDADARAIELTQNHAERALMTARMAVAPR